MKNRVGAGLLLVLLTGFPTLAHALDIGGASADIAKAIGAFVKLIFGLILFVGILYMLFKKN